MMCSFSVCRSSLIESIQVATGHHVESDDDIRLGKTLYKGYKVDKLSPYDGVVSCTDTS
jgi:hypothetical protein